MATIKKSYLENYGLLNDPTEIYHQESKFLKKLVKTSKEAIRLAFDEEFQKDVAFTGTDFGGQAIHLPGPLSLNSQLDKLVLGRRTQFGNKSSTISLVELSTLLYYAYGINGKHANGNQSFRTVPSAGALYPLDIYILIQYSEEIKPGIYLYSPHGHSIAMLNEIDWQQVNNAFVDAAFVNSASAIFLYTCSFWRTRFKYGHRGYRFALLEAGHSAQNMILSGSALELRINTVGAYYDDMIEEILRIDGVNQGVLYATSAFRIGS